MDIIHHNIHTNHTAPLVIGELTIHPCPGTLVNVQVLGLEQFNSSYLTLAPALDELAPMDCELVPSVNGDCTGIDPSSTFELTAIYEQIHGGDLHKPSRVQG